ncbi:hypothetical protein Enr13x_49680 [Stieleria neptunia]|uniref:YMGG-like Gly-zipper domain-containing protein n=2 Tax=Stieleria neptunia TaxID=2527979 RepID=A0A518HW70_9BACT|nr:hypothetical protein Enr13x_49680 [Stieleria neptunia]
MNTNDRWIRIRVTLATVVIFGFSMTQATAQENTQRGAVLGGLAGAVTGGLIGDHNDEAGAGAAIGGAIGAITGGLLGNAADKEKREAQERQQYALQQQAIQRQAAISMADVISMTASGLSDTIIINQISQRGVQYRPQVSDIITLHDNGVREPVIAAMQRATIGQPNDPKPVVVQQVVTPAAATPVPVIVETRRVTPYYYRPAPAAPRGRRPISRGSFNIRF